MKKAYHEAWVLALHLQRQAKNWHRKGLLDTDQLDRIKATFPENFYKANVWIKVALFLFTFLLNGCASTLTGAMFLGVVGELSDSIVGMGVLGLLYGGGFFVVLDFLIRDRRLYHSGIDNALLYSAVASVNGGLCLLFSEVFKETLWVYGLICLPTLAWATWRYASRFLTAVLVADWLSTVVALALTGAWGVVLLPFILMAAATPVYVFVKTVQRRESAFYWESCLVLAEIIALVVFYAAGNYFVMREGNAALHSLPQSIQIAFAPLFYAFTLGIPAVYLAVGFRQKARLLLNVGLLAAGASVLTFQHYVQPVSWAQFAVLSGALLLGIAAWLMRYLREPKGGFSAESDERAYPSQAEALSVTEQPQVQVEPPAPLFGGGSFGGAGAGTEY